MLASSILENFQVQAQIQNPWITLLPVPRVPDRIMLIQDSSSTTSCYITRDYFMSLKGPCQLQVLQSRHNSPSAGHFGFNKIMELISRDFWWPQMWKTVKDYVTTCDTCSRCKIPRHQPYELLQPLPIPETPWTSISMDFIVDLPKSKSFDSVFVVVDWLTKMAHFVP
jgi:hypothetical protein